MAKGALLIGGSAGTGRESVMVMQEGSLLGADIGAGASIYEGVKR